MSSLNKLLTTKGNFSSNNVCLPRTIPIQSHNIVRQWKTTRDANKGSFIRKWFSCKEHALLFKGFVTMVNDISLNYREQQSPLNRTLCLVLLFKRFIRFFFLKVKKYSSFPYFKVQFYLSYYDIIFASMR